MSQNPGIRSYVAIGDSQTEGLNDGDDHSGFRGWADRLAERLAGLDERFQYANLAVRGRLIGQVRAEQLEPALAMRPDFATVVAGLNDIIRPGYDHEATTGHLEAMIAAMTAQGARVATITYPDVGAIMPIARRWQPRVAAFNQRVREIAAEHGAFLVETDRYPVCTDTRIWSTDRLHLNTLGHTRLAGGFAHALGLPDSGLDWTEPLPPRPDPSPFAVVGRELRWAGVFLAPWLWRRLRGRSSGDGRSAKRPELSPLRPGVAAQPQDVSAEGTAE